MPGYFVVVVVIVLVEMAFCHLGQAGLEHQVIHLPPSPKVLGLQV